jgi:2-amino-4-hydroxy-6-hydroxymethyldihydropteridine diphosphokinase
METERKTAIFLGLGGNLRDPLSAFRRTRQTLSAHPAFSNCRSSPLFQTPPYGGPTGQPDYLNAVLALDTDLDPQDLLTFCQSIEQAEGRERLERWGARTLDIDLLLYGQLQLKTCDLEIPHPRMLERRFVLEPLVALAPEQHDPKTGQRLTTLLERLPAIKQIQLLKSTW